MTCISLLAAFGITLGGCADAPAPARVESADPSFYRHLNAANIKVDPAAARDMISIYRRNKGLGPVAIDPALQKEAEAQAQAMARANKMSHDVRGSLMVRLNSAGFAHNAAVENVSAGYLTLAEAFSGWRDSPPHNRNMLEPKMHRMGIATAYAPGSKYRVYWALVMTD